MQQLIRILKLCKQLTKEEMQLCFDIVKNEKAMQELKQANTKESKNKIYDKYYSEYLTKKEEPKK